MRFQNFTLVLLLIVAASLQARAWNGPSLSQHPLFDEMTADDTGHEMVSTTQHSVMIDGKRISYTAKAGYLVLKKEDGEERARIFYIAYTRDESADVSKRPLTFSFNGGPGSSSVWLHLGVLGPKRVLMTDEGETLPPPYQLVENEFSWLDLTDLVFIDPVSTGYSRAVEAENADDYHGVNPDIASVGEFIQRYLGENDRWSSPKYVIGESYGTTRAAGLSLHLQNRYGLYLNGIVLVSAITNFQTARFDDGNDLPYITFLPTYAASAWYHKKLSAPYAEMTLEDFTDEVRKFAMTDYTLALMQGDEISQEDRNVTIKRLAAYTGLSETWLSRADMRINIHQFTKELLRDDKMIIGRFDSRYTGIDMAANDAYGERDPSYQPTIQGCFSTCINDYLGRELRFETDLPYEVLTGRVHPWSYKGSENRYLNTSSKLRLSMERNPDMRIWIANGYYDLATPFYATEYTLSHMGLSPLVRKQVYMTYYPAGHMMYLQKSSLEQMKEEANTYYSGGSL